MDDLSFDLLIINTWSSYCTSEGAAILYTLKEGVALEIFEDFIMFFGVLK